VLCYGAALVYVFAAGTGDPFNHDVEGRTEPFGDFGDKLVAPFARWDSVWYLRIADDGYEHPLSPHFYPLYPLLARVVGTPVGSSLIGGVLVSLAAFMAALYLLHRLVDLELGRERARQAVLLMAFFPSSLFFSAVYTESLFLVTSLGAFYAARTGRWAWAGAAAGLAATTRAPGVLLLVPLLLLYLYGRREDRERPDRESGWLPRHKLGPEILWLLAVPGAIAAHMGYLWAEKDDPFAASAHQAEWDQHLTFPLVTLWNVTERAVEGTVDIFSGGDLFPDNVYLYAFVWLAIVASVGLLLRRLPLAYSAHAAIGAFLVLAYPRFSSELASTSRYLSVYFPIVIWLALWTSERRIFKPVLVVSALLMMFNAVRFATWEFVG
jgi:hypothetical protein